MAWVALISAVACRVDDPRSAPAPAPHLPVPTTIPSSTTPEVVDRIVGPEVVCADPGARDVAPFDRVEDGDWGLLGSAGGAWGIAAGDFDGDGRMDVLVPTGVAPRLFLGSARGLVAAGDDRFPPLFAGIYRATSTADVDGDGDLDLLYGAYGSDDWLLVNDGHGYFDARWLGPAARTMGGAFGDVDGDGDLDLAVATGTSWESPALLVNDGYGQFDPRPDLVPKGFEDGATFVLGMVDLDQDGWTDLYRANDAGPGGPGNQIAWNRGGWFEGDGGESGLDVVVCSMGLGIADVNGDRLPDLGLSDCQDLKLLESTTVGVWVDHGDVRSFGIDPASGHDVPWGVELVDLDNDEDLDSYVAYGYLSNAQWENAVDQRDGVYLQQDDGAFLEVSEAWGIDLGQSRGFVTADIDGDGWLDVVKHDWHGVPVYYRSRCGSEAWLRVELREPGPNPFAVGARIVVDPGEAELVRWITAGTTSVSSGGPPEAHFGLGGRETVRIEVTWPDGAVQLWEDLPVRRRITLIRPEL
jgi:hypothetical protein